MADGGEDRGGPNHRRRLNPPDNRTIAAHIHQKVFTEVNTNREVKGQTLDELIHFLTESKRVDGRELTVNRSYKELPAWVAEQPLGTLGYYRGMRSIIGRVHSNRCSYFNHLLNGRAGCKECLALEADLRMAEKELEAIQKNIANLGGRVWKLPCAFSLPLALLDVD